ncbi:prepilin-type N-terminal cleavage/methylation domain-containing protein [Roseateles sp. LYH14W]|uniref:Prepilin-type N-terminal cleavage/methylation domain-containing protein n=1 Tax=Pelomonas parva TaxID=3299032 RepID=A0ABW7FA04_9BURK
MLNVSRGYSLIELLVVLGILGLLATLAMPMAEMTVQRERERELRRAVWEIRDAIDAYKKARDTGAVVESSPSHYPPTLAALTELRDDARADRLGQPIRFLRRVPRDPFAPADLPAERTWGLRSYQSEAGRPQPGVDVYDVYSLSDRVGLNGVPLRDW